MQANANQGGGRDTSEPFSTPAGLQGSVADTQDERQARPAAPADVANSPRGESTS